MQIFIVLQIPQSIQLHWQSYKLISGWPNFRRHKNCPKRYNSNFIRIFAPDMYSLKEAWIRMFGVEPIKHWDGKMYCAETDADMTYRTNETNGHIAAYTFTLIVGGRLTIIYNGRELTLRPNDLYIYSPGMSVTIVNASDDYHGFCLLADEHATLAMPQVHDLVHIAYKPIVQLHQPQLSLSNDGARHMADRMLEIKRYLHSSHIYKAEILRMLYAIFLLDLQNLLDNAVPQHTVSQRVEEIFIDFMQLLPEYFVQHHDIGFYASQLNISPVYLSRIVRQVAGCTVVDYINKMLLMEASFLLRTTDLTIAQIGDRLHFADSASFCKFFSRMKGLTPKEFRRQ